MPDTPLSPHLEAVPEPEGQVIQMPLGQPLTIPLHGQNINIVKRPDGARNLVIGPVPVMFILPLQEEGARLLARELVGGLEIATALPPDLKVEP
jgi:hypothetical protein